MVLEFRLALLEWACWPNRKLLGCCYGNNRNGIMSMEFEYLVTFIIICFTSILIVVAVVSFCSK